MKTISFQILRTGLAITFLWIGVMILQQPKAWVGYLQPWAARLLPIPIVEAMIGTAVLDIAIGALLFVDSLIWLAAFLGVLHLIFVLVVSGITDITVRDIAILAGAMALMVETLPQRVLAKIK